MNVIRNRCALALALAAVTVSAVATVVLPTSAAAAPTGAALVAYVGAALVAPAVPPTSVDPTPPGPIELPKIEVNVRAGAWGPLELPQPGSYVTFTVLVQNTGTGPARNVDLFAAIPAGALYHYISGSTMVSAPWRTAWTGVHPLWPGQTDRVDGDAAHFTQQPGAADGHGTVNGYFGSAAVDGSGGTLDAGYSQGMRFDVALDTWGVSEPTTITQVTTVTWNQDRIRSRNAAASISLPWQATTVSLTGPVAVPLGKPVRLTAKVGYGGPGGGLSGIGASAISPWGVFYAGYGTGQVSSAEPGTTLKWDRPLSAGDYHIVAHFYGDPVNLPSASSPVPLTVYFSDYPPDSPFFDDVMWLADEGIATGNPNGTFDPRTAVTREAMAAYLYRFAHDGARAPDCMERPFPDVALTNPFCGAIAWLKTQGITTGNSGGTFRPTASVQRQAMAAFMFRFASGSVTSPTCASDPFTDVESTMTFCGAIAWLVDQGISGGYPDGTFRPAAPIERQAMAAFLHRLAQTS